ncbi:MAG: acetyl-CoA carboxylase biotin carboxyl carrier protein subunit [Bacteroidales bacterium]|nr:acetyl-CoA carboxylase biotin carboxyl carrier protein subunit [Bacteroidales bacterium]
MRFYKSRSKPENEYIAVSPDEHKFVINNPFSEQTRINGHKKEIRIYEDEDGFNYLEYKSKRYLVEIIEKIQNKYTVLLNGVSYSFTIESPISFTRRKYLEKQKQTSKFEIISAPMPGKIIELLVEENSRIREGDSVLILEAMKMQNEIIAQTSGKVKKILVKAGDNVAKEEALMEIEK